ncbi:uncharacterized protein LOC112568495 [Pomacea canaliculata]|uniref:uncharacterized protein LOC112568495 n=1 Tax=Pomacea canaliculata TaxID=400727 RepID=UPI000D732B5C|nr:uncharacterized protein LOC112568495 [Pomacea canaliculata]
MRCDINMAGPENKTAVMLALEKRNWSVFWQLIQLGACYDWAEADQFLLLKKLYLFPKRNVQCEKLCGIINFLAHPGLNLSPGVPSVLQSQQSSENGFTSSESTEAKGQCGSDNLERLQSSFEKCVRCSNWTVANVILESGPDIDIKRPISGRPLIHVLVSLYEEDDHEAWLSFLTVLLRRGLDISSRDDGGRTVLMKHTVLSSFRELNTNPKALCRVLLEKGVNPSMVDDSGNSLLTKIMKLFKTSIFTIAKSLFEVGLLSCKTQFEGGGSHTLFISKLIEAVLDVKPAVVKILFECGAISNRDMFLLSEEYSVVMSQELDEDLDDSEMDDLYQILQQAATQVQSLQSLCRIAVSCSLPLGVNRRDTVRDFPPHLKEYLLFFNEFSDLDRCSEIEEKQGVSQHHKMEDSVQDQQELQQEDTMPLESTPC